MVINSLQPDVLYNTLVFLLNMCLCIIVSLSRQSNSLCPTNGARNMHFSMVGINVLLKKTNI